jgi:DNA-binding transcriptional regulator LsrR (DeoR family)
MSSWLDRHNAAVARQDAALSKYQKATRDRAAALKDGEAELGSQAEVARALGVSRAIVNRAIKKAAKRDITP